MLCRRFSSARLLSWILCAVVLFVAGCETAPEPMSYQEALEIHKAEVELLNSLKSRRLELTNSLARVGTGDLESSAAELAGALLQGATEQTDRVNNALDEFGEIKDLIPQETRDAAEKAKTDANALTDKLTGEVNKLKEKGDSQKAKIEAEIAELDKQIAAQEAKVAKALADKDAAEARR